MHCPDGGYAGQLIEWVPDFGNWVLDIVKSLKGRKVLSFFLK